jgi:choline monooxygenase
MFIHKTQLPHPLRPDQYFSDEQHRVETRECFMPAWHLVASMADMPNPGDFVTTTLCDKPILVRNFDGEPHAFLNVCAHRHSLITSAKRGSSEKMRCQFHGWEYRADGRTREIPDARSFKQWDRKSTCLQKFRVQRLGELVFVSLQPDGQSLEQFLAPAWDIWAPFFDGKMMEHAASWDVDCESNWKIAIEIQLESYHVPLVHPLTFRKYPDEEVMDHVLEPNHSRYWTSVPLGPLQEFVLRTLGMPISETFQTQIVYPHLVFAGYAMFGLVTLVQPTSPTTCCFRNWLYTARGTKSGSLRTLLRRAMRSYAETSAKKVLTEDIRMFSGVQRGMRASPHRGVLSAREEQVYAFQRYIEERSAPSVTLLRPSREVTLREVPSGDEVPLDVERWLP